MMRILSSTLLILAALALAGCGDSDDDTAVDATPAAPAPERTVETVTPAPEAPAAEIVTPAPAAEPAPATPEAVEPPPERVVATVERPADLPEGVFYGMGTAIEGDVFSIDGVRMLLYGVDTVEPRQTCYIDGQPWDCWPAVVRQLQTFLAEGPATCTPAAPPDPFRRQLVLCEINGESLNEKLIRSGFAIAFPDEVPEFAAAEEAARAERIGLWQGQFQSPSEWRAEQSISTRRP